jgi:hypothetical protein
LLGSGAGFVGPAQSPVDLLVAAPLLGQFGRFLGQVGGLLSAVGGLCRAFGLDPGLLGQAASLPGLVWGLLWGTRLSGSRVPGHALGRARRGGVLVFYGAAGDAIGLAGRGHALAGCDLASLVLSHDHFFPGETARVYSPR